MSGKLVRKFRWFWDDADHAIERWLQDMARQGLHLKHIHCLRTVFIFERGEPAQVTYRLDFLVRRKDPHYVQLFTDAGWEHVDEVLGWQYWRAPSGTGREPEIFTDAASQIKKYQRLLCLFALAWLPLLCILPFKHLADYADQPVVLAMLLASAGVTMYAVQRLLRRIRTLREQAL